MRKNIENFVRTGREFTRESRALHPWLLIFALTALPAACFERDASARGRAAPAGPVRASDVTTKLHILSCHDGDTCKARNAEGLNLTLRLVGVDAPEVAFRKKTGQTFGFEAKVFLEKRVKDKTLTVRIVGNDPYQRHLALLLDPALKTASRSVNEELIREGFAFAYSGKAQRPDVRAWAQAAQDHARKNQKGLWALPQGDRPVDPSEFRHAKAR